MRDRACLIHLFSQCSEQSMVYSRHSINAWQIHKCTNLTFFCSSFETFFCIHDHIFLQNEAQIMYLPSHLKFKNIQYIQLCFLFCILRLFCCPITMWFLIIQNSPSGGFTILFKVSPTVIHWGYFQFYVTLNDNTTLATPVYKTLSIKVDKLY